MFSTADSHILLKNTLFKACSLHYMMHCFNLFALAIKLRLICKYNDFNSISIIVVFDKKSTLWNLPAFVMVII